MKARQQRLVLILIALAALGLATYLVLNALGGNLSYFFSPTEVIEGKAPTDRIFRLGGMVQADSVARAEGDLTVTFTVTDHHKSIPVAYTGILPDLFAEGQGMIAQGKMNADGVFIADEVLAKHDENYMPPEVAAAMDAGQKAKLQSTTN
jgi:cytochrome c-type biogenesis protein CcmE